MTNSVDQRRRGRGDKTFSASDLHTPSVIAEIWAERQRQVEAEGWTPEHDDEHGQGELAQAAAVYASGRGIADERGHLTDIGCLWPWSLSWFKPYGRRRDLIRAAALIVAEIERLDRAPLLPARDGEPERCPICDEPKVEGQLMLVDVSLGEVHAACCGPERESYVNVETGDPIGPDEPIPTGYPYKREG